jgi:hypothetical protein
MRITIAGNTTYVIYDGTRGFKAGLRVANTLGTTDGESPSRSLADALQRSPVHVD